MKLNFYKDIGSVNEAIHQGIFASVSATTNGGLDITGDSLAPYANDYFVQTIIMLLIIYVLSAAAAIVFSSLSLAARLKFKNKGFNSIIYFGDIAELSGEEFLSKTAQMTENDIVKDLKTQIVINSRISKRKLKYFNLGLISSIVLFASAIILLIIIRFAV